MWFWWFMFGTSLLIPAIMIVFGFLFCKKPPKTRNSFYGYRTRMSMKNEDTWKFAHHYCGRIFRVAGLLTLGITLAVFCFLRGKDIDTIGSAGLILCIVQMVPLVGVILPTEVALRKQFDAEGRRKKKKD